MSTETRGNDRNTNQRNFYHNLFHVASRLNQTLYTKVKYII